MTLPTVQATRGSFGNAMFPKRVATACGAYCLRRVLPAARTAPYGAKRAA